MTQNDRDLLQRILKMRNDLRTVDTYLNKNVNHACLEDFARMRRGLTKALYNMIKEIGGYSEYKKQRSALVQESQSKRGG